MLDSIEIINDHVKVEGLTPSDIADYRDSYDRGLAVRNAQDLLEWMKDVNKIDSEEFESLSLMINSNDIEDFDLALIIIKTKKL
ncbi:MAG: hypothetical protein E6R13_03470 [Spirochaetes bacterium]|nr:MAG: hypothetical protein E6R13_03470 [Spirochaetota bacterium]